MDYLEDRQSINLLEPLNKLFDDEYKCPGCNNIFKEAFQSDDCGCRFCKHCFHYMFSNNMSNCPICNDPFMSYKINPDKCFQNEINNLKVNCFRPNCSWSGRFKDFFSHYYNHDLHLCNYCSKTFNSNEEIKDHLDILSGDCPKQKLKCPYDCSFNLKEFVEDSSDSGYGDSEENTSRSLTLTREEMKIHLKECAHIHLNKCNEELNEKISKFENELYNSKNADIMDTDHLANMKNYLEHENQNSKKESFYHSMFIIYEKNNKKLDELNMKFDEMEKVTFIAYKDINILNEKNEKQKRENEILKEEIKNLNDFILNSSKQILSSRITLLTFQERILNIENVSYDGTILFKITNFMSKHNEAAAGRTTNFFSPAFYTNQNGYKMSIRVYPNGDGQGKNTHLSLFFVILKGEYDALLSWPFKQVVKFILYDQSDSKEHLIDSFKPDPNSSSFKKPTNEMNIASGLPLFCPISKLFIPDKYIKDDTVFIKAIVETNNILSL